MVNEEDEFMRNKWLQLSIAAGVACAVLPLAGQGRGGRGGPPVNLPDGAGKPVVETHCQTCHSLNNIVNSGGYSREGWITLTKTMIALPDEQRAVVADYLAAHFPEKPRPAAVIVPGPAKVSFREWLVPTLGSRPHDPLAMPDGTLWYTGQFATRCPKGRARTA
jgi:virginiamycin B lyase